MFVKHGKCSPVSFLPPSHPQPRSRSQIREASLAPQYNYLGYPCTMACSPHYLGCWVCVRVAHVNVLECECLGVSVYGGEGDGTGKTLVEAYSMLSTRPDWGQTEGRGWGIGWGRGGKGDNMSVLFTLLCSSGFHTELQLSGISRETASQRQMSYTQLACLSQCPGVSPNSS